LPLKKEESRYGKVNARLNDDRQEGNFRWEKRGETSSARIAESVGGIHDPTERGQKGRRNYEKGKNHYHNATIERNVIFEPRGQGQRTWKTLGGKNVV